jgi:hypothetical protein
MGQCSNLLSNLGKDDAIAVVRYYLTLNERFYRKTCHALGCVVTDFQGIRTQMLGGFQMTETDARKIDEQQSNQNVFERVMAKLDAERQGGV